jgi:hypothetical protein
MSQGIAGSIARVESATRQAADEATRTPAATEQVSAIAVDLAALVR